MKQKLAVRIASLPEADDIYVRYPSCTHVNKLICFNGTVTKAFSARMIETSQTWQCNKCGYEFNINIDYGQQDLLVKPAQCPKEDCKCDKFKNINAESRKRCFVFFLLIS